MAVISSAGKKLDLNTGETSGLVVIESAQVVEQLREAIQAVALAADANKYAIPLSIKGIRLEVEDGHLVLVATDRFRMHVARVKVEGDGVTDANAKPVSVNAKELAAWAKTTKGACQVAIRRTENHVELETNNNLVRLVADDSEYPNWRDLVSKAKDHEPESVNKFAVNGKYAYELSKAYSMATGEKNPHLQLEMNAATKPMLTHVEGKRFTFTGLLMPIRISG